MARGEHPSARYFRMTPEQLAADAAKFERAVARQRERDEMRRADQERLLAKGLVRLPDGRIVKVRKVTAPLIYCGHEECDMEPCSMSEGTDR